MTAFSALEGSDAFLVMLEGFDRPGLAARLMRLIDAAQADVVDVEQVQIHGRLLLCAEVLTPRTAAATSRQHEPADVLRDVLLGGFRKTEDSPPAGQGSLTVTVLPLGTTRGESDATGIRRHVVTVMARHLGARPLGDLFTTITESGGNIERIARLSTYPVTSFELTVSGGDPSHLRRALSATAARSTIDVAVRMPDSIGGRSDSSSSMPIRRSSRVR
jgi:phosphoserine phosphatase